MRAHRRSRRRGQQGSLFLVVLLALLCCGLIYLGFQYALYLGASRQVRNAVDASVLNISKRVVEIKVNPNAAYTDCTDTSGTISIATLNRIWAKAYLINANVDEMRHERLETYSAIAAADLAYDMAQQVNDSLSASVKDKTTLDSYFNHLSSKRKATMLGGSTIQRATGHVYPTAMVDRGAESNLSFNRKGLPMQAAPSSTTIGDKDYLQGYSPFIANNKTFYFMSFRNNETPHLISDAYFQRNRLDLNPLKDVRNPVPNAYQGIGSASQDEILLNASACAVVNPQQQYQMTIPQSFIKVKFQNQSIWMVDDTIVTAIEYPPKPVGVWGIPRFKLKDDRMLSGFATLGKEFKEENIRGVIDKIPANHDPALERLRQRAQEIDPSFDLDRIDQLLRKQATNKKATTYYIFPSYRVNDYSDPELDIQPQIGGDLPSWLNMDAEPEGGEKEVVKEEPFVDKYNAQVIIQPGNKQCPKRVEIIGSCAWKPGTGMGQCLGTLFVNRLTKVVFEPGTEKSKRGF